MKPSEYKTRCGGVCGKTRIVANLKKSSVFMHGETFYIRISNFFLTKTIYFYRIFSDFAKILWPKKTHLLKDEVICDQYLISAQLIHLFQNSIFLKGKSPYWQ